jgi:hypothetical protein
MAEWGADGSARERGQDRKHLVARKLADVLLIIAARTSFE